VNIEEAINKLKNTPVDVLVGEPLEFALAKRLGIEGLNRTELLRNAIRLGHNKEIIYDLILFKLPSETEGK